MKVSVALAAYNGEKYIREQIQSILLQLDAQDEIVISDDGSTDRTLEIVRAFDDSRIKIFDNPQKGIIGNFNNALAHTDGDILFLADQDDVWVEGKVESFKEALCSKEPTLAISDYYLVDKNLNPKEDERPVVLKRGFLRNFIRNTYIGAMMCFNRSFLDLVMPIPNNAPMHDIYFSLVAEKLKMKIVHIEKPLIFYRRHGDNATSLWKSKNTLLQKLQSRWVVFKIIRQSTRSIKKRMKNG